MQQSIYIYTMWNQSNGTWYTGTPEEVQAKKESIDNSDSYYWCNGDDFDYMFDDEEEGD